MLRSRGLIVKTKYFGTPVRSRTTGFTLVELLIVVVILATIVVPQFLSAIDESRKNTLKINLHRVRTQIEVYG